VHRARHRRGRRIDDAHALGPDLGAITILEIDHALCHLQQRRNVGGREILALAQSHEQRRALARDDHRAAIPVRDDGNGEGAFQLRDRAACRNQQAVAFAAVPRDEVRDDLAVGVRDEGEALAAQARPDRLVVLDDPVVHHCEPARDMGVRVLFVRRPVRRPARVRDAGRTADALLGDPRREFRHAARGAHAREPGSLRAVQDGHSGGVVTAVFEAPQSFYQDGDDVTARCRADDSAHRSSPSFAAASSSAATPAGRGQP
jgi:hypothetical protein